jgi:hypothetical protein
MNHGMFEIYRCTDCGFQHDDLLIVQRHISLLHPSNIIPFKPKEKTTHEKITEVFGSPNYLAFYYTANGVLSYRSGDALSAEQLSFVSKILDQMIDESIRDTLKTTPHDH